MKSPLLRALLLALGIGSLSLPAVAQGVEVYPNPQRSFALSDTIAFRIFDYAQWRAYYQRLHCDSTTKPVEPERIQLLQIGSSHQSFVDYGRLRADSIWNASVKARKKEGEFLGEWKASRRHMLTELKLLFDRSTGHLDAYGKISINKYHYREPIPSLQWRLEKGDSTVLGYPCHKATTRFRGRDYVAWYTEEIAYPYGPYKFGGLPGLITCIYDTQCEYIYTLVGFEKAPSADYIYERALVHWLFETKREVFARLLRQYHEQPTLFKSDLVQPASRRRRILRPPKPYHPIELE